MTRLPRAVRRLLTALSCVALVALALAPLKVAVSHPWPLEASRPVAQPLERAARPRRATFEGVSRGHYTHADLSAAEPAFSASPAMAHAPAHVARASVQWGLDPTFGTGGVVHLPKIGTNQSVLRPDGKLVALVQEYMVSQYGQVPISNQAYLVGLTGTLEITRVLPIDVWAKGVQSDNKLIIGDGRYDANLNNVDPTFAARGEASFPAEFSEHRYFVQSDDKVLVTGTGPLSLSPLPYGPPLYSLQLRRLNSDGTVDTSFGSITLSNTNAFAQIGFDPHGRMVLGGDSISTPNGTGHVYSITGTVLGALPSPLEQLSSPNSYPTSWYTPDPAGGFVWFAVSPTLGRVGHIYRSRGNDGLDSSFGSSGYVTVTLPANQSWPYGNDAVLVKPDNSVVLVGQVAECVDNLHCTTKIVLVGLEADGSPDTQFGSQGYMGIKPGVYFAQTDYDLGNPRRGQAEQAVFLTADNKILIVGNSTIIRLAPFTVRGRVYLPALSRN